MTNWIRWFDEVSMADLPAVGGKNASLGEMRRSLTPLGVRTPDGFATTADAYREFLHGAGLERVLGGNLRDLNVGDIGTLQAAGSRIRSAILAATLPDELIHGVADAYRRLEREYGPNCDVAVRSSATAEDLPDASLFDQYRALPRPHTFDANAALRLDWLTVPGVGSELTGRLLADAPYQSMDALLGSPALSPELRARVAAMSAAMSRIHSTAQNDEETLSLWTIGHAFLLRLGLIVLVATLAGGSFARLTGVRRSWTAGLIAFAATALVIALTWIVTSPPSYPVAAPVVLGGVPWALWRLARRQGVGSAARALAAWMVAAIPSLLLTVPW